MDKETDERVTDALLVRHNEDGVSGLRFRFWTGGEFDTQLYFPFPFLNFLKTNSFCSLREKPIFNLFFEIKKMLF
jgi:hypothetical protein